MNKIQRAYTIRYVLPTAPKKYNAEKCLSEYFVVFDFSLSNFVGLGAMGALHWWFFLVDITLLSGKPGHAHAS